MSGSDKQKTGSQIDFRGDHSPDLHAHDGLNGYNSRICRNGSSGVNVSKQAMSREKTLDEVLFNVFDAFVASFRRQSALVPAVVRVGDQVDVFADDDFLMRGRVVDQDNVGNVKVEGPENDREVTLWIATFDCRHADGQAPPKTKREWEENRGVYRMTGR
jgi:hypothetical protein